MPRRHLNLLPAPRQLKFQPGQFTLPPRASLRLPESLPPSETRAIATRLQTAAAQIGVELARDEAVYPKQAHIFFFKTKPRRPAPARPPHSESYSLNIDRRGVWIEFREAGGARAAVATLRQLLRECGRRLPCLCIRDRPDFPRRGVMLDVSRGRVPKLATLLELVELLADFKINEFQLYTEHTFAYRRWKSVWQSGGALTGADLRALDARCRTLGIELVPNQNSFGHLRHFLEHPRLKKLAEVAEPYEAASGDFLRRPSTLAPNHPGTLPFLGQLYDELLPNFSSKWFNVGCDETWDLGRGQSRELCARRGQGRVYLDFLNAIHREVSRRGRRMMFWGDIILHHPKLIPELPRNALALNWGYEANHPFAQEAVRFARSKIPFYVCPGTSTWMTLIGRHDNALANLRAAARAGKKFGAGGYLITEWGDGGHPQPPAVSYLPFLAGAALSWCAKNFAEPRLTRVLSRDVFADPTGRLARTAAALGRVHRRLNLRVANETPLGTVITAPPPEWRELFCRNGLKYHAQISEPDIRATLREIERHRAQLLRAQPQTESGKLAQRELDLAAKLAAESCRFMLWQQAVSAGRTTPAAKLARAGISRLRKLEREFQTLWPPRNKGNPARCAPFFRWRMEDYRRGR